MSGAQGWAALVSAAVLVSAAELDGTCAGQFMVSRPIVLGPLLGLALGRPDLGLAIGALVECLSLEQLPVGGNLPLNPTVAAAAGLLLAVGPRALPPELSVPAGFGAGWAHRRLELSLRSGRRDASRMAEETLARGETPALGRLAARSLAVQAAATLTVILAFVLLLGPLLNRALPHAPQAVRSGLRFGFALSPWLGAATLLKALEPRR